MNDFVDLILLLQLVSLALIVALLLPGLSIVFGSRQLEHGFRGGPEELTAYWLFHIDEDLIDQLAAFGFRPVGIYWERMNEGRTFLEAVFVSETERSFAMLYPNDQIMPRRAAFLSVSEEGAVVFTKNYHGGIEAQEKNFVAGPPTEKAFDMKDLDFRAPLDEVLAEHRIRLSCSAQGREVPIMGQEMQLFLEMQQKYHVHPFVRNTHRSAEIVNLTSGVIFLSIIPGVLACWLGFQHPAPWIALCLGCVIGLVMRYGLSSAQVIRLLRGVAGDKPKPISEHKD